tara:strand:- start:1648 stop:2139 length:492 start_codon:yes stop_codon:yes gene_type:complete
MGYRSDVGIVVAFKTREDMEKVIATYKMNPDVQRLDLFAEWSIYEGRGIYFLQYKNEHVKWYDDYDDVVAIRYITKLVESFSEEQDMTYAWKELNVGEDGAIHENDNHSPRGELVTDQATELEEFCDDMLMVTHPEIHFGTEHSVNMDTIREIPNGEKEKVDG